MASKNNSRNHRNNPYVLDGIAGRFHHTAAGALWRWRTELIIVSALAAFMWTLRHVLWPQTALSALATVAAVAALPWARRFITSRIWCVISRHRLQRLCFETRMHTRSGRLPLILWIHPTKIGERAHIWCRAGICVEDFDAHIGEIRAACYARDARATRNHRWSQLITIDIIRHDLLSPQRMVSSHVAENTPPQKITAGDTP
jgi:hypothetical protein